MAAYNGGRFIAEQLQSFAAQTRLPDEVVICDDGSTDDTRKIVRAFAATAPFEVRFEPNAERLGYSGNFERAISLCSGSLIFLSDQDDVWLPDKLATVADALAAAPGAWVAVNDQIITDGELDHRGVTKLQNLRGLHRSADGLIEGCCTCLRKDWADLLLPIPAEAAAFVKRDALSYDRWLNELAVLLGVRLVVERPLQYFRRYGSNVTAWIGSEPRPIGTAELVAARVDKAPVEAWADRVAVLDLYRRWLEQQRGPIEAAGISGWSKAMAEVARERASLTARIALTKAPLHRRLSRIAALFLSGGYSYFYGWKSAVRDLVRSA